MNNNNKIVLCFPNCEDILADDVDRSRILFVNINEFKYTSSEKINNYTDEYIKVFNTDYPNNFIKYIKDIVSEKQEETRCILIEFHPDVLDILKYNGLNYVLIYPKKELKEEWIGRYHLKNIDSGIGNARYDTIGLAMHWDVYLDILINEGIHKPSRTHVLHYREKIKQLYLDGLGKTIYMKDGAMFYGYEG